MKRYVLPFSLFEAAQAAPAPGLTKEQEEFLNQCTEGSWTYDQATGLVDVKGDFDCSDRRLTSLKGIKFGQVSGYFDCRNNALTSLKGAPQKVGGNFYCYENTLTSLEGAPQEVGVNFYCNYSALPSLEGAPQKVGGNFDCHHNTLTSLKGAPQEVGGDFDCYSNALTSLEGAPQQVGVNFICDAFKLGEGEWNPEGWLEILKEGSPKAQSLILTLLTPELLNREIQKNPAGVIVKFKRVWNLPDFKEIRSKLIWPEGYEEEMKLVGGLNTLGF